MEQRDIEMQRLKDLEERRLQVVLEEYKGRYERERGRLLDALNITAQCTKKVRETLPECLALEERLFGRNNKIAIQSAYNPPTHSLPFDLQCLSFKRCSL